MTALVVALMGQVPKRLTQTEAHRRLVAGTGGHDRRPWGSGSRTVQAWNGGTVMTGASLSSQGVVVLRWSLRLLGIKAQKLPLSLERGARTV